MEENCQRRYQHQRRNSFHDYETRQVNSGSDNHMDNRPRRSTSLEDRDRQTNHEPPFDHRTEWQEPIQGFQTNTSVSPIDNNIDNLNGRRQ